MRKFTKLLVMATMITAVNSFADMDTSRMFKDKKGNEFVALANSNQSCIKGEEVVTYTLFESGPDDVYGCVLTYHYFNKKGNKSSYRTDKVIKYSRTKDSVCMEKLKVLVQKLKKLKFTCTFSGIG